MRQKCDNSWFWLEFQMKIPLSVIVEEINDKHMAPWAEICVKDKTENTPLTPFMNGELLQHCHLNLSNEKLKATGYRLKFPILTQESIEEVNIFRNEKKNLFLQLFFFSLIFCLSLLIILNLDRQRFRQTKAPSSITFILRLILLCVTRYLPLNCSFPMTTFPWICI